MDITRKNINDITFEEVVEFCQQRVIENLFLNYKRDKPADLSKHIAGFSNASGGLIIIGVEEDTNGYPTTWAGIDNVNKPTDWAHQMANNVVPFPSYETAVTNEVGGKVFLLVRILEGDSTPYVTKNDPTVWVRTGNIRSPIDQANREDLLRLFERSAGAAKNRKRVDDELEFEFRQLEYHQNEYEGRNRTRLGNLNTRDNSQKSLLRVTVTPFNPSRKIIDTVDLSNLASLHEKFTPGNASLAVLASDMQPTANGLANVRHVHTGQVESLQVKNNGVVGYVIDIAEYNGGNNKSICVYHILKAVVDTVLSVSLLYRSYGYSGIVNTHIELHNVRGANIYRVTMGGMDMADDGLYAVLPDYVWDLQLATIELNNKELLVERLAELLETFHWDLGDRGITLENAKAKIIQDFNFNSYGLADTLAETGPQG